MTDAWRCRWCRGSSGDVVLDLDRIPAADHFPVVGAPGPDPVFALRAVMCRACRLTQLEDDPTSAEEPRGVEPAALVDQARAAIGDLRDAGVAREGASVREFGSPHGGSWLPHAQRAGMHVTEGPADLVVDSLGIMHEPDQRAAFEQRAEALAPDGVLALHVHPLATILRDGTWNALRHGHYAYYALPVLARMAARVGLTGLGAWTYPLYGGTVVVAFTREGRAASIRERHGDARRRWEGLVADEERAGTCDPGVVAGLGRDVVRTTRSLRRYVRDHAGSRIGAYAAASRAVPLLAAAGITASDVVAVADASSAKWGRALPGSRIPVVSPAALAALRPDRVVLFVPDLLVEARAAVPVGRWAVVGSEVVEVGQP